MDIDDTTAYRWLVSGRVQGVSYRWFTCDEARRLGLSGTVRNLADGRVEVFVAGTAAAVDSLRERLRQGPPAARVEAIDEQILASDEAARIAERNAFDIVY